MTTLPSTPTAAMPMSDRLEGHDPGIVATNVSLEDYLQYYAEYHCEYVEGVVIKMSPSSLAHQDLISYLKVLLDAYLEITGAGRTIEQPFLMKLPAFPNRRREPDLMVVLNANLPNLTPTALTVPADIVIEIVSPESVERDRGEKFVEYEQGGVPEYWLIDPLRAEAIFYRRSAEGLFIAQPLTSDHDAITPLLPGLKLHVPTLWSDRFPGPAAVVASVRAMLTTEG